MPLVNRIIREAGSHRLAFLQIAFGLNDGLRSVGLGFCLFAAFFLSCGSTQAQTNPTCELYGAVGVAFAPNLAVTCAGDSSITSCSLVMGTIPFAPGINTLGGCVISGTPTKAGPVEGFPNSTVGLTGGRRCNLTRQHGSWQLDAVDACQCYTPGSAARINRVKAFRLIRSAGGPISGPIKGGVPSPRV